MITPLKTSHTPEWLEYFRTEPKIALDAMLRGLARVPPYERAAPPDILDRLFGGLPQDDPDRRLLDDTLRDWLAARRADMDPERGAEYGLSRLVTELMGALSTVWLLGLPGSGAWLQDNFLELSRRAAPLRLSEAWDLPRALAQAAALTQTDQGLRLHWLRLCKDAARPSRRHMIDPALSGLSNLPDTQGRGANPQLIAGLARFGAGLASTPRDQRDFLRRWRGLKARFPRTGKTWRGLWQATLTNRQYRDQPFIAWLQESEPALRKQWTGAAPVSIPRNIPEIIRDLGQRARTPEERPRVLAEAERLLANLEHYAEATGDADFLVRSASNLGNKVLIWAPGHALAWSRDALRWSPNNGYAWDLRGRALERLGHPHIAQAVYWEAARRLPDNAVVRNQLARLLQDQGREAEAETLFRETCERDPGSAVARVELARLLARTGREDEAETLLRETCERDPGNAVAPYTLALLLIAQGRREAATAVQARYVETFGEDERGATLRRLLEAGDAGSTEARKRLAERDPHSDPNTEYGAVRKQKTPGVSRPGSAGRPGESDAETAKRTAALEGEERGADFLRRAADAGRADLLFRIRDVATAEQTLAGLLADAAGDDLYPRIVWALHVPTRRAALAQRYRQALGALAPHLAAAGPETPAAHWERLYEAFPERRGLIDLTRLMRSNDPDEAVTARLEDWIAGDAKDAGDVKGAGEAKGAADAFLRARLAEARARDGRIDPAAPGLAYLLNAAIRGEVDLGDAVLAEAA